MRLTASLLLLILLSSCTLQHQLPVSSTYDRAGQFDTYHSFALIPNEDLKKSSQNAIETGIKNHLEALGYVSDVENPSFYIRYQVYEDHFSLATYEQVPLANRMARQPYFDDRQEVEHPITIDLAGTALLVSMYDPELTKVVWRGTIDHLKKGRNERAAAQLVMNQYRVLPLSNGLNRQFTIR